MRRLLIALAVLLTFAQPAGAAGWTWPVSGEVITPYRNGADPYAPGQHRGVDIAAPVGTPVVAAASGEVRFAGTAGSNGLTVGIRTADGFDTSYLHMSALSVRAGGSVAAGDRLGAVGTSGSRSADEPHLHFGVREAGSRHAYRDPLSLLGSAPAAPPGPAEPQPLPAPAPAPMSPTPAPAPARGPGAAPSPRPFAETSPRLRPRPAPAPLRRARGAPAARPDGVPDGRLARAPDGRLARAPDGRLARASAGQRGRAPAGRPHRVPAALSLGARGFAGERRTEGGSGVGLRARDAAGSGPSGAGGAPGPDLGLALACAGLLLAAALLGRTEDGRRAVARSRTRVSAAIRPLLGRR